jgi:hypothetical protein
MTKRIVWSKAFLIGFAFAVAVSFTQLAGAWNRTVASTALVGIGAAELIVPFPSDGTTGTPNGNSTTTVYADFYGLGARLRLRLQQLRRRLRHNQHRHLQLRRQL